MYLKRSNSSRVAAPSVPAKLLTQFVSLSRRMNSRGLLNLLRRSGYRERASRNWLREIESTEVMPALFSLLGLFPKNV